MREIKSLPELFVKAIDDRTVTGIFSVYGNVDLVGDKVWPGAFTRTFQGGGRNALFLWQHDAEAPPTAIIKGFQDLTRNELPPEVLEKAPDAVGGAQVTRTYLDTPRGNEVLAALKAGSPLQASFAYDALRYDFSGDGENQVRNLYELKLYEVSDVNWGANDATVAAGKAWLEFDFLMKQLDAHLQAIKSGARHSAADMKMLNSIHDAAVSLGADNCKGVVSDGKATPEEDDEEQKAEQTRLAAIAALTLSRRKFQILELETALLA